MRELSLAIVGIRFPNRRGPTREFELRLLEPGEPLELRPEPKNPADENAIAVFSARNVQLGYVVSERAVLLAKLMREGREVRAIYQGRAETGAWMRVSFDGREPTLPIAREHPPQAATAGDPCWPDPEWPD